MHLPVGCLVEYIIAPFTMCDNRQIEYKTVICNTMSYKTVENISIPVYNTYKGSTDKRLPLTLVITIKNNRHTLLELGRLFFMFK